MSPKRRLLKTEYTSHCLIVGNKPLDGLDHLGYLTLPCPVFFKAPQTSVTTSVRFEKFLNKVMIMMLN